MDDWSRRLRACRQNLGSRTGEFWKENRRHLEVPAHERLAPGDALDRLWKEQETLFTRGDVQLAAVVMANENLYRRAWVGAPALVVLGADPRVDPDPEALQRIAGLLYGLKVEDDDFDVELEPLADRLRDETTRFERVPVPAAISGDVACVMTTIYVHRDALPGRWLAGRVIPVLSHVESTPAITVLPERYWPDEMAREWRAREPTDACPERPVVEIRGYAWPVPVLVGAGFFTRDLAARIGAGDRHAYDDSTGWMAASLAVSGALVLAFDVWSRRPSPPRYFAATCGHPIEVRYDRRLLRLQPRVWAWILLGAAAFLAFGAAVR